jgi:hypothetical protein
MRGMGWVQLIETSVAAGGPIDVRAAAPACGLSVRAVRDRCRRECWWRPYPNIVSVPGTRRDGLAWAKAATLHAAGNHGDPQRDLAALTRTSALALLGLQRTFPTRTEVVIDARRVLRSASRLQIVRSRRVRSEELEERDGVPVVIGTALLRDLSAVRTRAALRSVAIDLAKAGVVDLDVMPAFLQAQPTFPGKSRLRQVAADLLGAGRTDSPFELEVRERLADEGIVLDRGQVPLPGTRGIHLDLGILAIRFGIELNSLGHHGARAELDRDASRANAIAALDDDWRVLHATWSVLSDGGWEPFVEQARQVITAQSRRHLGTSWPCAADLRH